MTVADLEVVFDILVTAPEKIHYIVRRAEIEQHMRYLGDELDLLGLYLKTGFNLGEAEFQYNRWVLIEMSKPLDEYYTALDNNIIRKKPSLRSTNLTLSDYPTPCKGLYFQEKE
jgi:hypothetical protein